MSSGSAPVTNPGGNDSSLTFPNSYIVTLHPTLTETQRKTHMDFAHRACNSKTIPGTREPASIARVYHYPFGSANPEYYGYHGKFGKDVADVIAARRHEVESIRLEAMGTLCNWDFETKNTPSWALSAISKGKGKPDLEEAKSKDLKGLVKEAPYIYKHIKSKGKVPTIFVLDTGYESKSHTQGPNPLSQHLQDRVDWYDETMIAVLNGEAKTLREMADEGRSQDDLEGARQASRLSLGALKPECADMDRAVFHGTNVALTAASSIWGSCDTAKVISYGICHIWASEARPSEGALIEALECMVSQPEILKNSVVNCSWTMAVEKPQELNSDANQNATKGPPYALRLLNDVAAAGAHIVAAACNSNLPLYTSTEYELKKSQLTGSNKCKVFDYYLPTAAKEVTIVGAIDREGHRADFSNYPSKGWPDIPFIWAPGVEMPGWKKNGDLVELNGTSFAAPIVSGVIASIIAARDGAGSLSRSEIISALVQNLCLPETGYAGKNVYRLVGPRNPGDKQPAEHPIVKKEGCSIF